MLFGIWTCSRPPQTPIKTAGFYFALCIDGCAFPSPPHLPGGSVAALALRGIRPATVRNLDWAFDKFSAFCIPRLMFFVSASVFNSFLADFAQFYSSASLAKTSRSAVCWLADILGFPRPVDRMTLRLVFSISRAYKAGSKAALSFADFKKIWLLPQSFATSSTSSPSPALGLLNLLFMVGLRPCALHRISSSSSSSSACGKLFTRNSKGFPNGVSVFLPPAAVCIISFLSSVYPEGPWYLNSSQGRDTLIYALRSALATDPLKLPDVNLRAIRSFYATYLYNAKVSSAFIMRQLSHSFWHTSCTYINLSSPEPAAWRAVCDADPNDPLIPAEAFKPVYSFDDPAAFLKWKNSWRSSFSFAASSVPLDADLLDDDSSDIDDPVL